MSSLSTGKNRDDEIAAQGQRLNPQERSWFQKMPSWTAVSGEELLRRFDGLVDENVRLRGKLEQIERLVTQSAITGETLGKVAALARQRRPVGGLRR